VRAFARLYVELEERTTARDRLDALTRYFGGVPASDAAWALHLLLGRKPPRSVSAATLRAWAADEAQVPAWLLDECYRAVGDLAEMIALLLPEGGTVDRPLAYWIEEKLLLLDAQPSAAQRAIVLEAWRTLGSSERFVWNRLITGGFRPAVSRQMLVRALSEVSGVPEGAVAHRLTAAWEPTPESYARLIGADVSDTDISRPYPFCRAAPLEDRAALGDPGDWLIEWKWNAVRAQLIRRGGQVWLWSLGDDLLNDRFPEVVSGARLLPEGTVLDGELIAWRQDAALPFAEFQRRIGRRAPGPKLLAEVPTVLLAFDLLEQQGADIRERSLRERRAALATLAMVPSAGLQLSPPAPAASWEDVRALRDAARTRGAEGLMLRRWSSSYRGGRALGDWWEWMAVPLSVDAVLIYAEPGYGQRAGLYTDYTFGVWDGDRLIPFARASSGLTEAEVRRVDAFVRRNTLERFGPVRTVRPELVFEIAFEGIQPSPRHKSGVTVRSPRVQRWRTEKRAEQADTLATLRAMIAVTGGQ
jgi:DNA ligase-1